MKITPSDLKKQAEELHAAGKLPSLEDVLQAVAGVREKYQGQILEARKSPDVTPGAAALKNQTR
jgi:hypothetical protein